MVKVPKKPKKTFNGPKSRKLIRKEKRAEKKQRKNEYYVNRTKGGKFVLNPNQNNKGAQPNSKSQELFEKKSPKNKKSVLKNPQSNNQEQNGAKPKKVQFKQVDSFTEEVLRDKRKHQKLQKEMKKQRKIQLEEANREEDKVIKRLEKDLKLNKRKSKSIPKSFEADGLDYLLEMCDPEKMKNVVASEQQFTEGNDDFEEDFALISGKTKKRTTKEESEPETEGSDNEDPFFQSSKSKSKPKKSKNKKQESDLEKPKTKKKKIEESNFDSEEFDSEMDKDFDSESSTNSPQSKTTKKTQKLISNPPKSKLKSAQPESDNSIDMSSEQSESDSADFNFVQVQNKNKNEPKEKESSKKSKLEASKIKMKSKSDETNAKISKKENTLKLGITNTVKKPKGKNVEMASDQDEEAFSGPENDLGVSEDEMDGSEEEMGMSEEEMGGSEEEMDGSEEEMDMSEEEMGMSEDEMGVSEDEIGVSGEEMGGSEDETGVSGDEMGGSENSEQIMGMSEEEMGGSENEIGSSEECSPEEMSSISDSERDLEKSDGTWEDIYGRKRTVDGDILPTKQEKYIPPALRNQSDPKRSEKLLRLRKQCKGLLNRLAESNMHSISTQIEELFMSNSRNDMNETLTNIIFESLISVVHTPERLLLEHVMLIAILHANVGTEVGATFLLNVIKKFDELLKSDHEVENKQLDNTVHIIAQLYNFKVFHAQLLYQIIEKLSSKFEEKHVECILLVLKNVGFSLRKDDPIALKQIILDLQKRASGVSDDNARVKFMLDILLAIKNNNVTKIPNYDTSYSEHLKKLMKGFIRKGNYVTQLNISLEDLLKADERGKWWVVGSAWTGMEEKKPNSESNSKTVMPTYSKKLLNLAKKQRMNTDTRRNIFCIIMTAEDYLDAFEKLLHLGLKNQQEREIIHVILHCCLQEQKFNPYYAVLAQKFCDYDRRFQMTIRCSIWDKLKALTDCSGTQLSNMAKLLAHLFLQQSLPISTLKVIEFGELDKITLRFMRQVLLSILLHDDQESCLQVFSRVATTPKLKMFRDSLRLFIHHFLLKNLKEGIVEEKQRELLTTRAQMVEKALVSSEYKSHLM